ncbi:MAG TPA: hypothetical protein VN672_00060 [Solirubrobacteraceae bacterium]|nr:hypothetical protein [Solirubrobacteraceae bacterium]
MASPIVGATVFCLGVLAASAWAIARAPDDSPVREAEAEGDRTPGPRRILLVASETPTGDQLQVLHNADPEAALDVHAPVLQSRAHFVTTDIDRETELARQRLRDTLGLAARAGIDASGQVGDPIDPLAGIEDQLRRHHVDQVVVATHPLPRANWVESDLLEQLRAQLDKPLTHIEVG